jgi:acetylornithine deacetylase/succinyl-diaminopimelate desuccinylase-like protein
LAHAWFQPSNLEITTIDVGNGATNLIPATARARINIRFNGEHRGADLVELVRRTLAAHAPTATVRAVISGESFNQPARRAVGAGLSCDHQGGGAHARTKRSRCPIATRSSTFTKRS